MWIPGIQRGMYIICILCPKFVTNLLIALLQANAITPSREMGSVCFQFSHAGNSLQFSKGRISTFSIANFEFWHSKNSFF